MVGDSHHHPYNLLTQSLLFTCTLFLQTVGKHQLQSTWLSQSSTTTTGSRTSSSIGSRSHELLCNYGSAYECICQTENAPVLSTDYPSCQKLVKLNDMNIIEITLRKINLTARLHTAETYESYFKRRIAAVVSNYCEQQAEECMDTTLRLQKENIVILNVTNKDDGSTGIGFVVAKSQRRTALGPDTVLDSVKIRYILSAQLASLSRILGGVRIERIDLTPFNIEPISQRLITNDNTRLIVIIGIVAAFLITTYLIAVYRVCRDCIRKRAQQNARNDSKTNATSTIVSNYGTIETNRGDATSLANQHQQIRVEDGAQSLNNTNEQEHDQANTMNSYRMLRMFQCDPSQLPAEEDRYSTEFEQQSSSADASNQTGMFHASVSLPIDARLLCNDEYAIRHLVDNNAPVKSSELVDKQQGSFDWTTEGLRPPHVRTVVQPPLPDNFDPLDAAAVWYPSDSTFRPPNDPITTSFYDNLSNSFSGSSFDPTEPTAAAVVATSTPSSSSSPSASTARQRSPIEPRAISDSRQAATKITLSTSGCVRLTGTFDPVVRSRTAHKFEHWSSESDDDDDDANHNYQKLSEPDDDRCESGLSMIQKTDDEHNVEVMNLSQAPATDNESDDTAADCPSNQQCYRQLNQQPSVSSKALMSHSLDDALT